MLALAEQNLAISECPLGEPRPKHVQQVVLQKYIRCQTEQELCTWEDVAQHCLF